MLWTLFTEGRCLTLSEIMHMPTEPNQSDGFILFIMFIKDCFNDLYITVTHAAEHAQRWLQEEILDLLQQAYSKELKLWSEKKIIFKYKCENLNLLLCKVLTSTQNLKVCMFRIEKQMTKIWPLISKHVEETKNNWTLFW